MLPDDNAGWSRATVPPRPDVQPEAADTVAPQPSSQHRDAGQPDPVGTGPQTQEQPVQEEGDGAPRKPRSLLVELPVLIVVALVIALLIKSFVVQAFFIPTGSMQDTLAIGDKVLVNKLVYHFRHIEPGDIVVFSGDGTWNVEPLPEPAGGNALGRLYDDTLGKLFSSVGGLFGTPLDQVDYVKRVIGVPGDHVRCCTAQGFVTVNGVPLREQSYLYPGNAADSTPAGIPARFNVTVPPGYLWVLGDHRSVSDDSRGHEADPGNGMILESKVIGRAFVIAWPPSRWRILPIPSTFGQPGIDRPATAAGQAARGAAAAPREGQLLASPIRPEPSGLPLLAGFGLALPLTWLQCRARRRIFRRWNTR